MKKLLFTAILSCLLLPCFSNAGELELTYSNNFSIYVPTAGNWFIEKTYSPTIGMQDNAVSSMPSCGFKNMTIDGITPANLSLYTYYYTNNGGLNYISCNMSSFTNGGNFDCKPSSNVNNKGIAYCVLRFNRSGVSSISLSGDIYLSGTNIDTTSCPSCPDCPTCEVCKEQYTSLECQTEYNLIPIESVTASYCKLNYDLIEPTECPINTGTGDISRTPRFINNSQYPGTALLRITIPDYIGFSVTYNTGESYVEIEGLNADTSYIENVINNEKLTPTNEDFEKLIGGLATFIPYLFIALLIIRMVKIFNKIWK